MRVMALCLSAYNDEEVRVILNVFIEMYMRYREEKEGSEGIR
ncbi:hypothetical protein [uncultured Bacteroides sp.]|jgi:hypothetical protein|nr:hypothetical protein [uncultured Bacteroides sp.]